MDVASKNEVVPVKEANTSLSLSDLAKPRDSVFGRGQSDTVAEIADLPKLDVQGFLSETHITEGMGVGPGDWR